MIGKRFGRLVVIERAGSDKFSHALWRCKCDCGNVTVTNTNRLNMGKTKSCGCLKREGNNKRHGDCRKRLNKIYRSMKGRCLSANNPAYKKYGGRGITICDEWLGNDGYIHFREWALRNGYKDDLSIDRIDNDKGYSPENCRWAAYDVQANNTRRNSYFVVHGERHTIGELSKLYGIPYERLYQRVVKLGWTIERALGEK